MNVLNVLHIDDQDCIRNEVIELLTNYSGNNSFKIESFSSPEPFLAHINKQNINEIIILDYDLGSAAYNGIDLIKFCRLTYKTSTIILLTNFAEPELSLSAMKAGADDFFSKDIIESNFCESLIEAHEKARTKRGLITDSTKNLTFLRTPPKFTGTTFKSLASKLPVFLQSLPQVLVIEGEMGTGKTLFTSIIEATLPTSTPFIRYNCNEYDEKFLSSELLGFKKGYNKERTSKVGAIERANQGYLVLEEISKLGESIQIALADFLSGFGTHRIGEQQTRKPNIKIIFTTRISLESLLKQKKITLELYEHLKNTRIVVPAYRDRSRQEKLEIIDFFMSNIRKTNLVIDKPALEILVNYSFHNSNCTELGAAISAMTVLQIQNRLTVHSIPDYIVHEVKTPSQLYSGEMENNHTLDSPETNERIIININNLNKFPFSYYSDILFLQLVRFAHNSCINTGNITNHTRLAQLLNVSRPTIVKKLNKFLMARLITKREFLLWKGQ